MLLMSTVCIVRWREAWMPRCSSRGAGHVKASRYGAWCVLLPLWFGWEDLIFGTFYDSYSRIGLSTSQLIPLHPIL